MSLYWRISSFPELEHLSEQDRAQVIKRCVPWRIWLGLMVRCFAVGGVCSLLLTGLAAGLLELPGLSPLFECSLPVTLIVLYQVQMILIRGSLRTFLEKAARTEPLTFCIGCGYNLIGNKSDRCPECGRNRAVAEKLEKG